MFWVFVITQVICTAVMGFGICKVLMDPETDGNLKAGTIAYLIFLTANALAGVALLVQ